MNSHPFASLILAATLAAPAVAQERQGDQAEHPLGQHPAVIIKERWKTQSYDYVTKFYPHPAWLYLLPEAPRGTMESPADLAACQQQRDTSAASAPKPLAKARH